MNPPLAVFFSLLCAISYGGFAVVAKKTLTHATAFTNTVIALLVTVGLAGGISLFVSPWGRLTWEAALWFAAGGVVAPSLTRITLFLGIDRVGLGRAMPLVTLSPFFSLLLAIFWLGERPGGAAYLATFCVAAGCLLVSLRIRGEGQWKRIHLLYPIAHSVFIAIATATRRSGMLLFPDAFIATTIASLVSLPVVYMVCPFLPPEERFRLKGGRTGLILLCGVLVTAALFFYFLALGFGEVSIVVPISYTAPLFSLLFARIWLREEERLDWRKVVGACLLFAGGVLIFWFEA